MAEKDPLTLQVEPGKLEIQRGKTSIPVKAEEIDDLIGKLGAARDIVKVATTPAVWEIGTVSKTSVTDPLQ